MLDSVFGVKGYERFWPGAPKMQSIFCQNKILRIFGSLAVYSRLYGKFKVRLSDFPVPGDIFEEDALSFVIGKPGGALLERIVG